MDGTGDATIPLGTAVAATPFPFGDLSPEIWAVRPWLWGGACLVLAAAAYLVVTWWRSYGGRPLLLSLPIQRWPNFQNWDERSEFELHEAATLWFDAEPRLPMWWRAKWKLLQWRTVIAECGISREREALGEAVKIQARATSSATLRTLVHRDVLKLLAEKEGAKPLFLFPERRRWADQKVSAMGQVATDPKSAGGPRGYDAQDSHFGPIRGAGHRQ
jgi:hypothetical protein